MRRARFWNSQAVIALAGGILGLFASYWWDLPSGAAIVCTFGVLLVLTSVAALLRRGSIVNSQ